MPVEGSYLNRNFKHQCDKKNLLDELKELQTKEMYRENNQYTYHQICIINKNVCFRTNYNGFFSLLDSQVNVFLNTKAKTTGITEISPQKFIFLDLQTALQKLHCLVASNSDVACNLFIPSNTEGTDGVPSCQ